MSGVEWRPLPGHDGYLVGDDGSVKSFVRYPAGRLLSGSTDGSGYPTVHVQGRGPVRMHVLVCEAFHGPRPEGMVVRHLNGDPNDNRPANLAYGTWAENSADMIEHGTASWLHVTHCPLGHKYDESTTAFTTRGDGSTFRYCLRCRKVRRSVQWMIRGGRPRYSAAERIEQIRPLVEAGMSNAEIAAALPLNVDRVRELRRRAGLTGVAA